MSKSAPPKKILLFFPTPFPYHRPWKGVPLALLAISRQLARENYDIKIFSRFLQGNVEAEILKQGQNSLCLGISAMTGFQIHDGLKIARLFKKKHPQIPIVWGGWHPSILPLETLQNKFVDIVVRGQGDITFTELVHALDRRQPLTPILGISYKQGKNIITNPDRPPVNLNDLPSLPYHLIDLEKCLFGTEYGQRTLPYISSYGCPHRCGFCVEEIVNKRHWVALNAQNVFKEWSALIKKYHVDSFAVYDSNFFVNEARVNQLCRLLKTHHLKIKWGNANGRVRQLSHYKPETWQLMADTGCAMILTGAESGNQKALDFISKDMNVEDIQTFTKLCRQYKIKILFSFLVGLPWSTDPVENQNFVKSEYQSTLSLIQSLLIISQKNRFTYYVFLPYPGAPLYRRAIELGYQPPKSLTNWSSYLMSPEDAFNSVLRQKWLTPAQARLTAILTQYIFGLLDQDSYPVLLSRVHGSLNRLVFKIAYRIGLILVRLRWKYQFFGFPLDYWVFTQVHKYGGLI